MSSDLNDSGSRNAGESVISPPGTTLKAGMVLANRFRLLERVGEGAVGVVWLAEDISLDGERVACKILRSELSGSREALAALKREVLLTRKLRHPNILAVYTFRETDSATFVTMEYIDGHSLEDALRERGRPFTIPEILPWLRGLSDALDYAHDQGVLHRDVKPANILLAKDGHVSLADFGIARMALVPGAEDLQNKPAGTLLYMCPERLTGGEPDRRSDLYSLAATVYHLLNGAPPFHSGDVVAQIQIKAPEEISHLSEAANRVLLRALSKSPEKRQSVCREFYDELSRVVEKTSTSTSPPTLMELGNANRSTVVLGGYDIASRRSRLGKLLIEQGAITQDQLAEALMDQQESGEKLGTILTRLGHTDEASIAGALSTQLQIPLTRLREEEMDDDVRGLMDREVAERVLAVPVRRSSYGVLVAMADPMDMEAINVMEGLFSDNVDPLMALESDVREAIDRLYPAEK